MIVFIWPRTKKSCLKKCSNSKISQLTLIYTRFSAYKNGDFNIIILMWPAHKQWEL